NRSGRKHTPLPFRLCASAPAPSPAHSGRSFFRAELGSRKSRLRHKQFYIYILPLPAQPLYVRKMKRVTVTTTKASIMTVSKPVHFNCRYFVRPSPPLYPLASIATASSSALLKEL